MPFAAVYDACVLYPFEVRDILMVAASTRLFRVHWSEKILEECTRNLISDNRGTKEGLSRMVAGMNRGYPDANVPESEYSHLVDAMTCDPKDRHVLAVAVCRKVDVIVTAQRFSPRSSRSASSRNAITRSFCAERN